MSAELRAGAAPAATVVPAPTDEPPTPEVPPDPVARTVDPRAVRVAVGSTGAHAGVEPVVIEPALGGVAPADEVRLVLVDERLQALRLERLDSIHSTLVEGLGAAASRTSVILLPFAPGRGPADGVARREVIVDGWRIEIEIESERRASLLERARRGRDEIVRRGPTEVRATIPGRVVAVSVAPGDTVVAGGQMLVVEAMKMQNELRAPRDGVVSSVAVGPGATIEVGDLLVVLG